MNSKTRETYAEKVKTIREAKMERGRVRCRNETRNFRPSSFTVMRGTHFLASWHQRGWDFNIFTDSPAAVTRIQPDVPGPDQDMAIEVIEPASNFREQDNTLTARRVPGHVGITGTEAVGTFANWRTWGEGERGPYLGRLCRSGTGLRLCKKPTAAT